LPYSTSPSRTQTWPKGIAPLRAHASAAASCSGVSTPSSTKIIPSFLPRLPFINPLSLRPDVSGTLQTQETCHAFGKIHESARPTAEEVVARVFVSRDTLATECSGARFRRAGDAPYCTGNAK